MTLDWISGQAAFKILLSVTVPLFTLVLSVTLSPSFAFSLIWWSRRHELKFASTGHERLQLFSPPPLLNCVLGRSPGTLGRWVMSISAAVFKMAEKLSGFHTWTLCIFNELSLWECISLLDYKLHTNHGRLMSAISFSIRLKISHYSRAARWLLGNTIASWCIMHSSPFVNIMRCCCETQTSGCFHKMRYVRKC